MKETCNYEHKMNWFTRFLHCMFSCATSFPMFMHYVVMTR
uniref:Uncharacterized protein n=1 Tax=Arundo donax TaxID=35708 RepID=A0A0A9AR06_ARUDO